MTNVTSGGHQSGKFLNMLALTAILLRNGRVSTLPPIQSSGLNKKYLRLEHTRPVITTQAFMLLRSTFSTGVSVLFHRWPTARFPFEYRPAYGSTSAGNCGPLGDSIHRGNGERDRDGNRKKPGQDVTAVAADTINLYGL